MSSTRVDLPLPETPVTQVRQPSGNETLIFLRLFSAAPTSVSQPSRSLMVDPLAAASGRWLMDRGFVRCFGIGMRARPER